MEENDILPAITATTTVIDAMDYRSIYAEMEEQEASLAIAFYHRHGFRVTEERKFEEGTTEYLVRMER